MKEIRTIRLEDKEAFERFQDILLAEKVAGNDLIQTKKVADFIAFVEKSKRFERQTDDPNWSTSTNYYYFLGGEIVARIGCRWELKGNLAQIGGHIGYVTRTDMRGRGIMTELLAFALGKYKKRGEKAVLITVREDNIPSQKTVLKAGGVFDGISRDDKDGYNYHRYWISLDDKKG